jgi:transposase
VKGQVVHGDGHKVLCDVLYIRALVAMRYNPDLKEKYTRIRAAGKHAKVGIVAVLRNLIEMTNALVRQNREWTQNSVTKANTPMQIL